MEWLRQFDAEKFLLFTLILTRVSGLVMTAPIFGDSDAPARVRALLAVILAALVAPGQWGAHVEVPGETVGWLVFIGGELLVGACLGLGVTTLFSGLQMAGDLISRAGGLTLSDVFDPTFNADVPLFSRLFLLLATAVFACLGGHRVVMAGLLDTFRAIPPGGGVAAIFAPSAAVGAAGFLQTLVGTFLTILGESFQLGVRVCAPVVIAALLATLALGLISRTMPQLNVLAVGFGLNALLTFAMMFLSLGGATLVFREHLEPALAVLLEMVKSPMQSQWFG